MRGTYDKRALVAQERLNKLEPSLVLCVVVIHGQECGLPAACSEIETVGVVVDRCRPCCLVPAVQGVRLSAVSASGRFKLAVKDDWTQTQGTNRLNTPRPNASRVLVGLTQRVCM